MHLIKMAFSFSPTTSRRNKREMGACATKHKVLEEEGNAPETREMVEGSGGAAGEEGESKSRQSLEILLKEVEVTEPAGDSTEPTKTKPPEEEDDDEVGNASETKETATVKVGVTVKQSVEEAMAKGAAVEKDEANNADVATLEKTMETGATTASVVENSAVVVESPVSRVVDGRQDR